MIYDCFLYNGEKELLHIRCLELAALNPKHILIESPFTFTGKEKPLHFQKHQKEFSKYNIDYYIFDEMPNDGNPWHNEIAMRNYIGKVLQFYTPNDNDVVIVSDVDEVPRYQAVEYYKPSFGLCSLQMGQFYYYLNCKDNSVYWDRARICNYAYIKDKTIDEVRNSGYPLQLIDAGWHWSWLGGIKAIKNKLNAFSHQELNNPNLHKDEVLLEKLEKGLPLWSDDPSNAFILVPIDAKLPPAVFQNEKYLSSLIKYV